MSKITILKIAFTTILLLCFTTIGSTQIYYPSNYGNTWVLESEDGAERVTYTIETSEETFNGKQLGLLSITFETLGTESITTDKLYVDFEEDGIKLYRIEADLGPVFGIAHAVFYPPALFYPYTLQLGDTWEVTAETEVKLTGPVTFVTVNEVVAIEDVVTPVRVFKNCVKIKIQSKSTTTLGSTRSTSYQWLAPNIGPVKFENTQDIVYQLIHSNLLYDVTQDGVINILDLVFVASRFGEENTEGDVNKDGVVNILDLTLIARHIGN